MRFVENDEIRDEGAHRASIRWPCEHDFATRKPLLERSSFKALLERRAGWYGPHTLPFDERGQIVGPFSCLDQGRRPYARRDVGA